MSVHNPFQKEADACEAAIQKNWMEASKALDEADNLFAKLKKE
jgi:hypothetical protein